MRFSSLFRKKIGFPVLPVLIFMGIFGFLLPIYGEEETRPKISDIYTLENKTIVLSNNALVPVVNSFSPKIKVIKRIRIIVTAYSSSVDETYGDPYITASGQRVRDGIVANNLLPLHTKVKLPELFGDKIFSVEDRMNSKKGFYHVDIWFPSKKEALEFGSKLTYLEIIKEY